MAVVAIVAIVLAMSDCILDRHVAGPMPDDLDSMSRPTASSANSFASQSRFDSIGTPFPSSGRLSSTLKFSAYDYFCQHRPS